MNPVSVTVLAIVLFFASWFTVWQRESSFPIVSSITTILLALPVIVGCIKWLGKKNALVVLLIVSAFAYVIESIGLLTGFPYGEFVYTSNVGILINNFIPLTLPFAWVPLLIGAYVLAYRPHQSIKEHFILTLVYLLAIDLVLDPGAVFLEFWKYKEVGIWYGVPVSNFFGWILSGSVGFFILRHYAKHVKTQPPRLLLVSYLFSVSFWTGVCLFSGIWGGVAIGLVLLVTVLRKLVPK